MNLHRHYNASPVEHSTLPVACGTCQLLHNAFHIMHFTISVNMLPDGNSVYKDTAVVCQLSLLPASCYCGQDGYQLMTSLYCSAILINKVDSRSLDAFVLDFDIPIDLMSSLGTEVLANSGGK